MASQHRGTVLVALSAYQVVNTQSEFDRYTAEQLPELLDHAIAQTKRFLRETGQWEPDVVHEKLTQRWGYELLERFLTWGRMKVPCRPVQLFDSFLFKHYSQSEGLRILENADSTLELFLDTLLSRAVCSRDAIIATFYHLYGLDQQQVAKILALGEVESQRIYKNYTRWRSSGWPKMVQEAGFSEMDLSDITERTRRHPGRVHREVAELVLLLQAHYRKSEPALYPCLSRSEWRELYEQDYGRDYRGWHLPFCQPCLAEVWNLRESALGQDSPPTLNLHIHPLTKASVVESCSGAER